MVAECTGALELRATAHLRNPAAALPEDAGLQTLVNPDGKGRFTVMLDPARRGKSAGLYQGIVPLEGDSVAHALEYYMKHSEQLDTRLWLAANDRFCAGLLLQRMPSGQHGEGRAAERHTDEEDQTWEHCMALADTVASQELLDLTTDALMHRLFWQDDVISFEPRAVCWHCSCSRDRVANMLRTLGRTEIDNILAEQGHVHIGCNFCGKPYEFDAVDCAALFAEGTQPQTPGSSLLH
jgi:molecular chaperone Hsp33